MHQGRHQWFLIPQLANISPLKQECLCWGFIDIYGDGVHEMIFVLYFNTNCSWYLDEYLSFHLRNSTSSQTSKCLCNPHWPTESNPMIHWKIQWFSITSWLQHHHGYKYLLMITPAVIQSPSYLTIASKAELCCGFNYTQLCYTELWPYLSALI